MCTTKETFITDERKRKREDCCIAERDYNLTTWYLRTKVDSSVTDAHEKGGPNGPGQKMDAKFSPTITVWGGICKLRLSPLVLVKGNISSVKNCEILEEGLLNSAIITNDIPFLLQQDNTKTHITAYTLADLSVTRGRTREREGWGGGGGCVD